MEKESAPKIRFSSLNRHHFVEKLEQCSHWLKHNESPSFSVNDYCGKFCVCNKLLSLMNLEKLFQRKNTKIVESVCTDPLIDSTFGGNVKSNDQLHCPHCFDIRLGDTIQSAIFFMPEYECTREFLESVCLQSHHTIDYDSAARHFHLISNSILGDPQSFFQYLICGIPRCIYDLNLFAFESINERDFYHPVSPFSNHIKYVCYLGFPFNGFKKDVCSFNKFVIKNNCQDFISIYYVKQNCPYVQSFEVWKKLVINWAEVDLPYCLYRKQISNSFADYLKFLYNGHHYDFSIPIVTQDMYLSLAKPFYKCRKKVKKWKFAYCNKTLIQGAFRIGLKPYDSTSVRIPTCDVVNKVVLSETNSQKSDSSTKEAILLENTLQNYLRALKESFKFMQARNV